MNKKIRLCLFVLIVLFVIFNSFDCVEIWYRNWFPEESNLIPAGTLTKTGAVNNLFQIALIIGVVQLISLIINNKIFRIIGICGSVLGALFSLRIPYYAILSDVFTTMGGLGDEEYIVSFFGYAVVIIAFAIVIMHIIMRHLENKTD